MIETGLILAGLVIAGVIITAIVRRIRENLMIRSTFQDLMARSEGQVHQSLWEMGVLCDPETKLWFENHPLHPNYNSSKPTKLFEGFEGKVLRQKDQ
jgi:hypothetical protein